MIGRDGVNGLILGAANLELAYDRHGRIAHQAIEAPQLPPLARIVEHLDQLALSHRQLLLVIGISIVHYFVHFRSPIRHVHGPLSHLVIVPDARYRLRHVHH